MCERSVWEEEGAQRELLLLGRALGERGDDPRDLFDCPEDQTVLIIYRTTGRGLPGYSMVDCPMRPRIVDATELAAELLTDKDDDCH